MQVAVWDTHVIRKDELVMHFDIVVPTNIEDAEIIYTFGKEYLLFKGQQDQPIAAKQCTFAILNKLVTK